MDMRKVGPEPLTSVAANKLLDLLATDDDFRALLRNDVEAALAQVGCHRPADDPGAAWAGLCLRVPASARLASKEHFATAREKLHGELTSVMRFTLSGLVEQ